MDFGHTFGVKVDGPLARGFKGFKRFRGERLTGLRPEGYGRLSAAGYVRWRSGGDSACGAESCGIALTGDEYKVSVTDSPFCVI